MIKRRKHLAIGVVIVGGAAALAAIVVHTLLPGSVIASVDVGPGYAPVSLTVDAGMGVAYVGRQDGGHAAFHAHREGTADAAHLHGPSGSRLGRGRRRTGPRVRRPRL
jgi:hypothetical protein